MSDNNLQATREEKYIESWLHSNRSYTDKFVNNWIRTHPTDADLCDMQKPMASAEYQLASRPNSYTCKAELMHILAKEMFRPGLTTNAVNQIICEGATLLINAEKSHLYIVPQPGESSQTLMYVPNDPTRRANLTELGIPSHVIQSGRPIVACAAGKHPQYKETGFLKSTDAVICMPIVGHFSQVSGAIVLTGTGEMCSNFTSDDEKILTMFLSYGSDTLANITNNHSNKKREEKLEALLDLTTNILNGNAINTKDLLCNLTSQTQTLIGFDVMQILLVDENPPGACAEIEFASAFEAVRDPSSSTVATRELELSEVYEIAAATEVAMKGEPMTLCPGVEADQFFGQISVLVVPITDSQNQADIIGVIQVIHNPSSRFPLSIDENLENLMNFAALCGCGINKVRLNEKLAKAEAKKRVMYEMLSYHTSISDQKVDHFWLKDLPKASDICLSSYNFDDKLLSDEDTVLASARMFQECGLEKHFKISQKVLLRWLLTVQKNYRSLVYHNWRHAFCVGQTMFALFSTGALSKKLTKLEMLALLMAAFCHDLDHRGTTNAFVKMSNNPLVTLYSTSTMEHHHFDTSIMILSSERNNVLKNLSPEQYSTFIGMLEDAILSTDLALYFKKMGTFTDLVETKKLDWKSDFHRKTLRSIMMTACDLGATAKPWKTHKRVAEQVALEFYDQGDLEREMLQQPPTAMMDRGKENERPSLQLGFIDSICIPLYETLATFDRNMEPLLNNVQSNRKEWQTLEEEVLQTTNMIESSASGSPIKITTPRSSDLTIQTCSSSSDTQNQSVEPQTILPTTTLAINVYPSTPRDPKPAWQNGGGSGNSNSSKVSRILNAFKRLFRRSKRKTLL